MTVNTYCRSVVKSCGTSMQKISPLSTSAMQQVSGSFELKFQQSPRCQGIRGSSVILGAGATLLAGLWRWIAQRQPKATPLLRRLLGQPVAAAIGMAALFEGLHALDAAIERTSAQGLSPPSADRSLVRLFSAATRLIENVGVGHRPYGAGEAVYLLLQYTPEIALIVAFVFLAHRTTRPNHFEASGPTH